MLLILEWKWWNEKKNWKMCRNCELNEKGSLLRIKIGSHVITMTFLFFRMEIGFSGEWIKLNIYDLDTRLEIYLRDVMKISLENACSLFSRDKRNQSVTKWINTQKNKVIGFSISPTTSKTKSYRKITIKNAKNNRSIHSPSYKLETKALKLLNKSEQTVSLFKLLLFLFYKFI